MTAMHYEFVPVSKCEMCESQRHRVLGIRMNGTQGLRPRKMSGIGVSVKQCMDCELIFADPRPKPEKLSDHYGLPPESYWTDPSRWELADSYFAREIAEAKQLLNFTPGMTALDIGAGLGQGNGRHGTSGVRRVWHRAIRDISGQGHRAHGRPIRQAPARRHRERTDSGCEL